MQREIIAVCAARDANNPKIVQAPNVCRCLRAAHRAAASGCESENQADRELMEVRESVWFMQDGFMG